MSKHRVNFLEPYHIRKQRKERNLIIKAVVGVLGMLCVSTVIAVGILETLSGCGEPVYKADGTYVTGECLFVPYTPVEGVWK